jgi:retinol dehydrogenase-14
MFFACLVKEEIDWDKIQDTLKLKYDGWKSYSNSKLANVLFTAELAKRLDGTGVSAVR